MGYTHATDQEGSMYRDIFIIKPISLIQEVVRGIVLFIYKSYHCIPAQSAMDVAGIYAEQLAKHSVYLLYLRLIVV